jgi:hypothetical protein
MRATYHLILPDQVFGSSMFRKKEYAQEIKQEDAR